MVEQTFLVQKLKLGGASVFSCFGELFEFLSILYVVM